MRKIFCLLAVVAIVCAMAAPVFASDVNSDFEMDAEDQYAVSVAATVVYPSYSDFLNLVSSLPTTYVLNGHTYNFDRYMLYLSTNSVYDDDSYKIMVELHDSEKFGVYQMGSNHYYSDLSGASRSGCITYYWDKSTASWTFSSAATRSKTYNKNLLFTSFDIPFDGLNGSIGISKGYTASYYAYLDENDARFNGAFPVAPWDAPPMPSFNEGLSNFWSFIGSIIASLPSEVLQTIGWCFAGLLVVGAVKLFN